MRVSGVHVEKERMVQKFLQKNNIMKWRDIKNIIKKEILKEATEVSAGGSKFNLRMLELLLFFPNGSIIDPPPPVRLDDTSLITNLSPKTKYFWPKIEQKQTNENFPK